MQKQQTQRIYKLKNRFSRLEQMRSDGRLCDLTIKVDRQRFKAHKFILAATMPYFDEIFTGDLKKQKDEVVLDNIKAENMELLLSLAYTGEIDLKQNGAESLMVDAAFLGLEDLAKQCEKLLEIGAENVLDIMKSAQALNYDVLEYKCSKYVLQNFSDVVKSQQFLQLSMADLEKILKNDKLKVASGEQRYTAMMHWLEHDVDGRREHLPLLLECVKLPNLTIDYLVGNVLKDEEIVRSEECRKFVEAVIHSQYVLKKRTTSNALRRIVAFSKCSRSIPEMETYDPVTDTWEYFAPSAKAGECQYVGQKPASLKHKLYAICGFDDTLTCSIAVYEPRTRRWKTLSELRIQMCNNVFRNLPEIVALGDYLYVCGGDDGQGEASNTVQRYCPQKKEWKIMKQMQTKRSGFGAVACHNRKCIYVCGGKCADMYLTSIECYDPSADNWTTVDASMKESRRAFGVAVLNSKIYICGGSSTDNRILGTVEVFDPETNTCEYVANMNNPRCHFSVVAYQGKLWAIGGNEDENSVDVYDPETDSWQYGKSLSKIGKRQIYSGIIPF